MATSMIQATTFGTDLDEVSAALRAETPAAPPTDQPQRFAPTILGRQLNVPQLLRGLGATVLTAAALTFMLQHWQQSDDISRYLQFLAFTAVLCAAGLLCGTRLSDVRGARTFLALAAAVIPAHFTFLGALLYSQLPGRAIVHYPEYARLAAPSLTWAVLTTLVGLAALAPIVWIAMLTLARPRAPQLTAAYLVANAFLLLPTRNPNLIGVLGLLLAMATALFDRYRLHRTTALRTREGTLARIMMVVPVTILFSRAFNLYEVTELLVSALFATAAILLFEFSPLYLGTSADAAFAQWASVIPAIASWLLAADTLFTPLSWERAALPIICLPTAAILLLMSTRSVGSGDGYRQLAALIASGGMVAHLLLHPNISPSFWCLLVAIITMAYGYSRQERGTFCAGSAAGGLALLSHIRLAMRLYSIGPWGSLALLGMSTVFAATIIEHYGRALGAHFAWLRPAGSAARHLHNRRKENANTPTVDRSSRTS